MPTLVEIARLKRLPWMALQREAIEAGLTIARVREARTRDELRRAILLAQSDREAIR